jgi:succinate-semialdehyde dehydrogenase / glutarate-semialdehyde dehydrogenase
MLDVERLTSGFVVGAQPERMTTYAPFTGKPIADVPQSMPHDVERAAAAAREAQPAWAARTVAERARVVLRFHDLLLQRRHEALDLVQLESGKARASAFEELAGVAAHARVVARRGPGYLRSQRRAGAIPVLTRTVEHHRPKGVVGVISPWNYPLVLGASDAVAALLAGNAVVQKPDSQTPLTAAWVIELIREAGLPERLWQLVLGDGPTVGGAIVDNVDYVCFTGSTATGRNVAQRAAARLIGTSLELGGKNPMLVLHDADIDRAVAGAVRACFSSTGQLCISTERIYVDRRIHASFLSKFVERVEAMRIGPGDDWSLTMGSLVSQRQLDRVVAHVDNAVANGARVLAGGRTRPDLGPYFYEPTVLDGVTKHMAVCDEETFGPVVTVGTFATDDEAVAMANDSIYGLNASVWTRDIPRAKRLALRIKAGSVGINDAYHATYGSFASPMGGMKQSGLGRRHGSEGLLKYTDTQTVAVQRLMPITAPAGVSEEAWAGVFTRYLRWAKRAGLR